MRTYLEGDGTETIMHVRRSAHGAKTHFAYAGSVAALCGARTPIKCQVDTFVTCRSCNPRGRTFKQEP